MKVKQISYTSQIFFDGVIIQPVHICQKNLKHRYTCDIRFAIRKPDYHKKSVNSLLNNHSKKKEFLV